MGRKERFPPPRLSGGFSIAANVKPRPITSYRPPSCASAHLSHGRSARCGDGRATGALKLDFDRHLMLLVSWLCDHARCRRSRGCVHRQDRSRSLGRLTASVDIRTVRRLGGL
jgi:hypothetical protein